MSCLIAAPCSGSGKTLLSLCLAAAARERGETLQPFKVGPDYLDPQLLGAVAGRSCRNLDPLLCGEAWVRRCFHWHGSRAERVLVEGVMGLFDGRGAGTEGSSAEVAALLDLPVVLVVEASRQAGSLAALVRGFRDHGPPRIRLAGVVLNRVGSERHKALLAEALETLGVALLGVLPPDPSLVLPSRHLGLVPPQELHDLSERQRIWAQLAEQHLDLERLWPLLRPPPAEPAQAIGSTWALEAGRPAAAGRNRAVPSTPAPSLPVAIACDAAFHFRYPEMGEFLRGVGLEPLAWSPLADAPLPSGCRAVVLPGGYPELHATRLAASGRSLAQLREAAAMGLPIVAECGGLLLLGEELADPEGQVHAMAGVLPFSASRGPLSLGYRRAEVGIDGLLVRRGEQLNGHEFHRWQLTASVAGTLNTPTANNPVAASPGLWQLEGWGVPRNSEGWTATNIHASWLHLHWAGCPVIPWRLAAAARSVAPLPRTAAPGPQGKTWPPLPSSGGA